MSERDHERPPSILYIHSHDTGRYVQPYGYQVPTPNIQLLADQGVLFRNAFCAAPTCSGSRASLLTGRYCHNNGMLGLAHRGWSLNDYGQHLVHPLRSAGYYSALIGEQHISRDAGVIGYDDVIELDTNHADDVAPTAISTMRACPQPFFLSVGFFETHRQFSVPTSVRDTLYSLPPPNLPDTLRTRRDMAAFKASARSLDQGIGAVLNGLNECGLPERTLIICTTDHGLAFPGAKATMFDRGLGVMLLMRGPAGFTGGKVFNAMATHLDLYPTICELAGVEGAPRLQGTSLLPLVRGETDHLHDAIFAEMTFHAAYEPLRAVRTRRWKYIRRFDDYAHPVLPNCDDSASKDLLVEHGWAEQLIPEEQLYDVVFDPTEARDLAGDPAHADVLGSLRERLDEWMVQTDDPLLQGQVGAPLGAQINERTQRSAGDTLRVVGSTPTDVSSSEPVSPPGR
jgi:N-sulfoglucosamine sulfohydrolase